MTTKGLKYGEKTAAVAIVLLFVAGVFVPASQVLSQGNIENQSFFGGVTPQNHGSSPAAKKDPTSPHPLDINDPWWDAAWSYRKPITINHTKVGGDLVNFPIVVDLSADTDLASKAQDDGDDLVFTTKTGTKLAHEIEWFDGTTGRLVAWVNVTSLSSTTDTMLYLYYGNTACESQADQKGVWRNGYIAVWHLNEDPSLVDTGGIKDSTKVCNGTDQGMDATNHVTGKIGYGIYFGNSQYVKIDGSSGNGHTLDLIVGPFTMETWFEKDVISNTGTFVAKRNDGSAQYGFYVDSTSSCVAFRGGTEYGFGQDSLTANTWYYSTAVIDSAGNPDIYRNGILRTWQNQGGTRPFLFPHQSLDVLLGARFSTGTSTSMYLLGTLDEIRISNVQRSQTWLQTCYNNQNSPSSFCTIGFEEYFLDKVRPVITNNSPANGSVWQQLNPLLIIEINDPQNDLMDIEFMTNTSGSWELIGGYSDVVGGTYSQHSTTMTAYNTKYFWKVTVSDGTYSTTKTFWFTSRPEPGVWWDNAWLYRKELVIDHTKFSENLANFPLLIYFDSDTDIAGKAQTDSDDLVFADVAGQKLNFEIEQYESSSGQLVAWVNMPLLSTTTDVLLYLYYGNDICNSQANPTGTWNSNYVAVWHLKEDPGSVGTGGIKDSTINSNHGTDEGAMSSSTHVIGKIGYGISFDGSNDVIRIDNSAAEGHSLDFTNGPFTIEAWFNAPTTPTGTLVSKREGTSYDQYQFYTQSTTTSINFRAGGEYGYGSDALTANKWYYGAVVVDVSNMPSIFRDGVLKSWVIENGAPPFIFTHRDYDVSIGARWQGTGTGVPFSGIVDEVRISNIDLSSSWVMTTYNNLNDPTSYYTKGTEEECHVNRPPMLTSESPINNSINIDVLQSTVSVTINDREGDEFDWTIEGLYLTDASGEGEENGSKTATLTAPLPYDTDAIWYVNATDGNYTRAIYRFHTRSKWIPTIPISFSATFASYTQIDLDWTKGSQADKTYIERNSVSPWNRGEGTLIYNGTETNHRDTGLVDGTTYYYQAWSWNVTDHAYSTTFAFDNEVTPTNSPPTLSDENPTNCSTDQLLNPRLAIHVEDLDILNISFYTNASGSWTIVGSNMSVVSGIYRQIPTTMTAFEKKYFWSVNASDGAHWTNRSYWFVTKANTPPVPSSPTPSNTAMDVSISLSQLSIQLDDVDNDLIDYTIETSPNIGSGSGNEVGNGLVSIPVSGLAIGTIYTWYVNITDPAGSGQWTRMTYWFKVPDLWWDTDWGYRKMLVIDHTKVAGGLVNFPVLINLGSDSNLLLSAQDDGDDLVFTTKDRVQLHHEIESFDGVTGKLVAWVNVASLSSTTDTILYLYYGNPYCANQQNAALTWDSNYVAVWHLKENPGIAGAGDIKDSTSYHNDGTDFGAMNAADFVSGKMGYGIDFDGSDDVIRIDNSNTAGHSLDLTSGPITLEAWFRSPITTNQGTLINKRDSPDSTTHYDQYQFFVQPYLQFRANQEWGGGDDTLLSNTWYYGAAVVSGSGWPETYRDGVLRTPWHELSTGSRPYTLIHQNVNVSIGARWQSYPSPGYPFRGIIDEVRISKTDRSSNWLLTSYNNQNNPSTFYELGPEEIAPPANDNPVAAFTFEPSFPVINCIAYFNSTSYDPDGTIASWAWDFGDSTQASGEHVTHQFTLSQTYTVQLTVTDNLGATGSITHIVTVLPVNRVPLSTYWNLISVPFNETISTERIKVSYGGTDYTWTAASSGGDPLIYGTLFNWDETTQSYQIATTFQPGQGYWAWAYHPCTLIVPGNATAGTNITPLPQRWNIIGIPYNTTYAKTDLVITYDGDDYTWQQATTGMDPIILGFLYRCNRTTQVYEIDNDLEPGYGYWLYAYHPCILKMET